jgi:hypothetical protein
VKCLHAHLAHTLAGGDNPVGRRVLECLARHDDEAAAVGHSIEQVHAKLPESERRS